MHIPRHCLHSLLPLANVLDTVSDDESSLFRVSYMNLSAAGHERQYLLR